MNEYFCEIDDEGEGSKPISTVKVRHGKTGEVKVFTVSGWSEAVYSATEVK